MPKTATCLERGQPAGSEGGLKRAPHNINRLRRRGWLVPFTALLVFSTLAACVPAQGAPLEKSNLAVDAKAAESAQPPLAKAEAKAGRLVACSNYPLSGTISDDGTLLDISGQDQPISTLDYGDGFDLTRFRVCVTDPSTGDTAEYSLSYQGKTTLAIATPNQPSVPDGGGNYTEPQLSLSPRFGIYSNGRNQAVGTPPHNEFIPHGDSSVEVINAGDGTYRVSIDDLLNIRNAFSPN